MTMCNLKQNPLRCARWLALAALCAGSAAAAELRTTAEQSGFVRTGRYPEVQALCAAFAAAYPKQVRCETFGTTPEGRPMHALLVAGDGNFDAAAARAAGRPVVLFQGGIHAGEVDGKDAGFLLLRRLLEGADPTLQRVLREVTIVFVPVFNVDGHERFGPDQRPNQNGPVEMGWRVTAQNINLNRDYLKAETPEMAAMLQLLRTWDPILYIDLHVTDGAKFQHEVAVMIEPQNAGPEPLTAIGRGVRGELMERLGREGHRPLWFYPSFERDDDPASGFAVGVPPPRFSNGYWPLRHRFGVLVETHSWKDYRTRVSATVAVLRHLLELGARDGRRWVAAARAVEAAEQDPRGRRLPLAYEHNQHAVPLDFQGYRYQREPSPISGALRIRYDSTAPQRWRVPLYDQLEPQLVATAPAAGYLVPAAWAALVQDKLQRHGLRFEVLREALAPRPVEAFRVSEKRFRDTPYEGRHTAQVKGAWGEERRGAPAGSLFVPIAQPGWQVLMHLLEPTGPDSLLAWGFFSSALEQKEYMEAYVAEAIAERMLAQDGRLREEFARKLAEEPAFAKDPAARLRFFHRRHRSWDERLDLYPVLRLATAPSSAARPTGR